MKNAEREGTMVAGRAGRRAVYIPQATARELARIDRLGSVVALAKRQQGNEAAMMVW